ncbi:MAG: hypothetical protein IJI73_11010 [Kiritimatiellae bacterium]|nr:hypothetical protein [Kiritimatiellia bacterium]
MKIRNALFVLLPAVAGCLGTAPKAPVNWTVEWSADGQAVFAKPTMPAVKLLRLDVRAPYSGTRLAVLRADGSIAFDPFNGFAAQPASLLTGAALDALEATGAFESVLPGASTASAPLVAEATVTKLALDCRAKGRRDAVAAVTLALLSGRGVVSVAKGEAAVSAADGGYSAAFSKAFSGAVAEAVRGLKVK